MANAGIATPLAVARTVGGFSLLVSGLIAFACSASELGIEIADYFTGNAPNAEVLPSGIGGCIGVGIDAANGVFLPQNLSSANPNGATVHSTLHTKKYYDMVAMILKTYSSKEDVISTLSQIRKLLENGEW